MKILAQLVLITTVFLGCQSQDNGVKVDVTIDNPQEGKYIQIQQLTETGLVAIDSFLLTEGTATITIPVVNSDFFRLNLYDRQFVNFIIDENDRNVKIYADAKPGGKIAITGSQDSKLMTSIDSVARKRQSDIQMLNQEAIQARSQGDLQTMNEITEQYYYLNAKHMGNMKRIAWDAIPSLAGLYAINYFDIESDFGFADSLALAYGEYRPDHIFTKDLVDKVRGLKSLAIGAPAPEIALPNPEGKTVKLSDLKGKYVLIDFWAAWCRPCRQENPNVVRLYNQYKGENFEIYGVSLDRKKDAWLKAIEDDGLQWLHVSDLKYFNSVAAKSYQINGIPATYLIDPEGNIAAKGLRGPTLEAKLTEIFD